MITSFFISFIASVLYFVFQFVPQVESAPEWWTENIYPTLEVFSGISGFPIVGTMIQIGTLALSFMVAWQGIVFANWLYNKIRGSG